MVSVSGDTIDGAGPTVDVAASTPAPTSTIRTGPLTPTDAARISPSEAAAIVRLGESGADVPHSAHAHGHGGAGGQIAVPLFTGDASIFANQWLAAVASVPNYDTIEKIAALGYVRASAPGPGIGTHWVLWSQVAKPFDPARPAMVLYDETADPPELVGYSYWVQSPTEPDGFAGPNDHWHQHTGLCVVNGWVDREEAAGPSACAGTYLAGGDLWMLHAWVVPGHEDRLGRFANILPLLCPSRLGTPDIAQCPATTAFGPAPALSEDTVPPPSANLTASR